MPDPCDPFPDDRHALDWLIEHMPDGQWIKFARALALIQANGGHGRITLLVSDDQIAAHPKAEISL